MENKKIKKSSSKKGVIKKNIPMDKKTKKVCYLKSEKTLNLVSDLAQALVITAIIILLTISFVIVGSQKKLNKQYSGNYFETLNDIKIIKKDKAYFGNLYSSYSSSASLEGSLSSDSGALPGMGESLSDRDLDSASMDFSMPEMNNLVQYNYIYSGDDFDLFSEEVDVLKKINPDLSKQFSSSLKSINIPFFDLNKLSNVAVANMTINEDIDFGYSIYLGLKDASFSLYKNWEKWPSLEKACPSYEYSCINAYNFSMNDVLPDQEILSITNKFLLDYKLPLSNYGPGEIQKNWMRDYILSTEKASFYIPDTISVIYPLKINNFSVYEDYGNKFGLVLEVDMRERKVSSLVNLSYQYYESSVYSTERNKDVILEMAKNGGLYPDYYYSENDQVKNIDIQIGKPSLELVKIWTYNQGDLGGSELFVPAYVFPILSEPDTAYFYKKNIVIPAVKDFFNNNQIAVPFLGFDQGETISSDQTFPIMPR